MENGEFADIEPMYIKTGSKEWIHPNIENYVESFDEEDNYKRIPVSRIYFKNSKGDNLYVFFVSKYIDEKCDLFFGDKNTKEKKYNDVFKKPFIDCDVVYECLWLTLIEDFWSPGTEQFCFSEFGLEVSDFFNDENISIGFFSLDGEMYNYGDGWSFQS